MDGPCLIHGFPVKHFYKDCALMKRYLKGELTAASMGKQGEPEEEDKEKGEIP